MVKLGRKQFLGWKAETTAVTAADTGLVTPETINPSKFVGVS